jgi:hypothetical protein
VEGRNGAVRALQKGVVLESVESLLEAAGRLETSDLRRLVAGALELRAKREAPLTSPRESELLLVINEGLPFDLARRLETLYRKRRRETLTAEEHRELIGLGDEVERREARRLEALTELAVIRQIPLTVLMGQLGLAAQRHG